MKTVLFVPGFQEDLHSRDYAKTIKAIEGAGYNVEFIPINWLRTTINDWVEEFNNVYKTHDPKQTILAGFSYGAMTVFMAAVQRTPFELWLFSLSPYFVEDMESDTFNSKWLKYIGHRRVDAFKRLSFKALASDIHTKTLYFYGDVELKQWPNIDYRNRLLASTKDASTIIAEGAKHDVSSDAYIAAIRRSIEPLA